MALPLPLPKAVLAPLATVRRSWSFATRLQLKRLQFAAARMQGRIPVVTYATWRTASTAVHHAVRASGRGACVKAHCLHPSNIGWERPPPFASWSRPARHVGDWAVQRFVVARGGRADWIMLVRDPLAIALSISAYALHRAAPRHDRAAQLDDAVARAPVACLDWWLEHDMRPALGWSALDMPFDRERGWSESECPHGRVLVLRADVPDSSKAEVLSRFLGARVEVVPSNDSRSAGRGGLLADLAGRLADHPSVIAEARVQRSARHFWHADRLEALRSRWLPAT